MSHGPGANGFVVRLSGLVASADLYYMLCHQVSSSKTVTNGNAPVAVYCTEKARQRKWPNSHTKCHWRYQ